MAYRAIKGGVKKTAAWGVVLLRDSHRVLPASLCGSQYGKLALPTALRWTVGHAHPEKALPIRMFRRR